MVALNDEHDLPLPEPVDALVGPAHVSEDGQCVGFLVEERWEQEGKLTGVSLRAGNVTFMIGQDDWKKGRDRKKGEAFRIYCTTTQDVDALAAKIKSGGGTLDHPPQDQPWGTREFALTDPDGFKFTIAKETKKR